MGRATLLDSSNVVSHAPCSCLGVARVPVGMLWQSRSECRCDPITSKVTMTTPWSESRAVLEAGCPNAAPGSGNAISQSEDGVGGIRSQLDGDPSISAALTRTVWHGVGVGTARQDRAIGAA